MDKTYSIIVEIDGSSNRVSHYVYVNEEGARLIYSAYEKKFRRTDQTMDRRQERGGICWMKELEGWIKEGLLPRDFNWKNYETEMSAQ